MQCLEEGRFSKGFSAFVFQGILHLFDFVASAKIMSMFFLKVLIQNGSARSWSLFAFKKKCAFSQLLEDAVSRYSHVHMPAKHDPQRVLVTLPRSCCENSPAAEVISCPGSTATVRASSG